MPTIKPATTQGMNGMAVLLVSFVFGVAAWRVAESLFALDLDSALDCALWFGALDFRLGLDSAFALDSARMLFVRIFAGRFWRKILEKITAKLAHTQPQKILKSIFSKPMIPLILAQNTISASPMTCL